MQYFGEGELLKSLSLSDGQRIFIASSKLFLKRMCIMRLVIKMSDVHHKFRSFHRSLVSVCGLNELVINTFSLIER